MGIDISNYITILRPNKTFDIIETTNLKLYNDEVNNETIYF